MFNSPVSTLTSLTETSTSRSEAHGSDAGDQSIVPSMIVTPVIARAQLNQPPRRGSSHALQYWRENFGADAVNGWIVNIQPGDPDSAPSLVQTREQSPEGSPMPELPRPMLQSTPPTSPMGSPGPAILQQSPPPPYQQWVDGHNSHLGTPQLGRLTVPESAPRSPSISRTEQLALPACVLPARSGPVISTPEPALPASEPASQAPASFLSHEPLTLDLSKSLLLAPTPDSAMPTREHTASQALAIETPEPIPHAFKPATAQSTEPGPSNGKIPQIPSSLRHGDSSAKSGLIGELLPPVIFRSPVIAFPAAFPVSDPEILRLSPSAVSRRLSSLALSDANPIEGSPGVISITSSPSVISITSSSSVIEIKSSPSIVTEGLPSVIVIDDSSSRPSSFSMDLDELDESKSSDDSTPTPASPTREDEFQFSAPASPAHEDEFQFNASASPAHEDEFQFSAPASPAHEDEFQFDDPASPAREDVFQFSTPDSPARENDFNLDSTPGSPGPSAMRKGKWVDPLNWGAAGIPETEMDIDAQVAAFQSFETQQVHSEVLQGARVSRKRKRSIEG
ncbi:hypothetical protein H1R20_g8804, partial [Candolleomyces eurysporus]